MEDEAPTPAPVVAAGPSTSMEAAPADPRATAVETKMKSENRRACKRKSYRRRKRAMETRLYEAPNRRPAIERQIQKVEKAAGTSRTILLGMAAALAGTAVLAYATTPKPEPPMY